ncbi:hypothetical protein [Burkholderia sp. LMG 32019]|uniref:hypothetical protein n=1 Tax=Burkholderia sp. LMG 32019 TaxID=3158173 RepID=UPI003C2F704F
MANDSNNGMMKPGAFSLSWAGGLKYGSKEMTFDGDGKFYFAKGDTINDKPQTGVGVFSLNLQNSDVEQLKDVARALCDKDIQTGGPETHDPAATFLVTCLDEGKVVRQSGSLRLIPERFRHQVFDAPLRLAEQARIDGRKIIKLDFETVGIEHNSDGYIVSVRFINSGERWVKFKTPDQFPGNALGGGIAVAPYSELGKMEPRDDWGFNLAGKKIINKNEFKDGIVFINPGEARVLKIEATPDNKIIKGSYEMSGAAFMNLEYEGYGWGLSTHVDFSPIKSKITFDRDYPSTPKEREQWEATHRATMSSQPVKSGDTFAEDGLYRAVRTNASTHRSLQLVPFKAGAVATTDNVKMLLEGGDGLSFDGPVQWLWQASAPTPVKQYSFDIIEDTRQFCAPGSTCPRSGRWLPRIREGLANSHRYDLAGIVTVQHGQSMPSRNDGAEWEWLGA